MPSLDYLHVDVFSSRPYGGNSLPVFYDAPELTADQMLAITQELRQFEAVFLRQRDGERVVSARVFDLFEELPFAGHPLVGAAAALEHLRGSGSGGVWTLDLSGRQIRVGVEERQDVLSATLDAGTAEFLAETNEPATVARAFSLSEAEVHDVLPMQVVSTGLRYLVVPVRAGGLGNARVAHDLGALLASFGAQFAVLLDPHAREIRHWNNDGVIEDIATGSAAGVVAAYCVRHGLASPGETFALAQGRFVGRPSRIEVRVDGSHGEGLSVQIGGPVSIVGRGTLNHAPAAL